MALVESQFGMPQQAFQSYQLWHRPGRGAIWIAHSNVPNAGVLAVETVGMQVTRRPPPRAKPSTYFAQKFGQLATRNVVDLPDASVSSFFNGEYIDVDLPPGAPRYCIVRLRGQSLGCGWVSRGQMRSQLPSAWTREWGGEMPVGAFPSPKHDDA